MIAKAIYLYTDFKNFINNLCDIIILVCYITYIAWHYYIICINFVMQLKIIFLI